MLTFLLIIYCVGTCAHCGVAPHSIAERGIYDSAVMWNAADVQVWAAFTFANSREIRDAITDACVDGRNLLELPSLGSLKVASAWGLTDTDANKLLFEIAGLKPQWGVYPFCTAWSWPPFLTHCKNRPWFENPISFRDQWLYSWTQTILLDVVLPYAASPLLSIFTFLRNLVNLPPFSWWMFPDYYETVLYLKSKGSREKALSAFHGSLANGYFTSATSADATSKLAGALYAGATEVELRRILYDALGRGGYDPSIIDDCYDALEMLLKSTRVQAKLETLGINNIQTLRRAAPQLTENGRALARAPSYSCATIRCVALVIGNSNYRPGNVDPKSISSPKHDAAGVAKLLRVLGAEVKEKHDLNFDEMRQETVFLGKQLQAVREASKGKQGAVGIFYFSGHGIGFNGETYLLPVDYGDRLRPEDQIVQSMDGYAVKASTVARHMEYGATAQNIIILDSCRTALRGEAQGKGGTDEHPSYAKFDLPGGTYISYAVKDGKVATANVDDNKYSVYTHQFLTTATSSPGLPIGKLLAKVASAVMLDTNNSTMIKRKMKPEVIYEPSEHYTEAEFTLVPEESLLQLHDEM
mmetsp:Transcript_41290/g.102674  ORF Transcript_41290/g.102674 Transcript_41290/m.102674 type:complete len:584 (+) Transcript_41290:84-1835(+)